MKGNNASMKLADSPAWVRAIAGKYLAAVKQGLMPQAVEARLGWPQGLCDCVGCWDRTVGASLGECDGRRCEVCDGSGLVWKGSEAA